MATITYTATNPDGITQTRSSGTMAYTHAVSVMREDGKGWGLFSWHKSYAAAVKAANGGYAAKLYSSRRVVEAIPTAINGKATVEGRDAWAADTANPNSAAIVALYDAKLAGKRANQTPKDAKASGGNADNARARKAAAAAKLAKEAAASEAQAKADAIAMSECLTVVEDPEAVKRARWAANKRASRARLAQSA